MIYESDIESYLIRQVEAHGGLCLKIGYDGLPDRLVLLPQSVSLWVELKRKGGKLSELQKWRISKLRKLGQRVEVPNSRHQVDEILRSAE